jgi:hypothetical protein
MVARYDFSVADTYDFSVADTYDFSVADAEPPKLLRTLI